MKNIFYGLILCAAVLSAQTNGLFPVITSTIPYSISDIQFISSTKGWIVGNSGMIMKSTDAGNSWTAVNSGVTNNLQKIHFVNDQVGYAGFTGKSSILRTSNGGTSWQVVNLPVSPSTDTARTPYAIYFLSPSTGFVGCGKSAASDIFMTTDSGKTWTSKLNLPDGSGLELLPELKLTLPKVRILMLTVFDDERSISQAIDLGADGFLLKRSGLAETAAAIRKTYAGEAVLSGSVAVTVLQVFKRRMLSKPMLPKLTAQENRLLRSLTEGSSLKQASGDIGVTYSTGRSYLRSIFTKLKVSSQTQAVLAMLGVAKH